MTSQGHEGDIRRLEEWVRLYGRTVRAYLLAMVRRGDVADDLTQEVFRRAWQARQSYQENGAARAYLLTIADRLVCDRARRLAPEVNLDHEAWQQFEPRSEQPDPSGELLQAEAEAQLDAALSQLTAAQRRVLLLRYYGQLDFAEIARVMECPLNTALSYCHRGLTALRKILAEKV